MERKVAVSRFIPASAETIFDLLADPRRHPDLDGSGTLVTATSAPERLSLGATFKMSMKDKVGYTTTNKVVVFEENKAIGWCHVARFVWRYDLEEQEGGTKVTESFDYSKPWGVVIEWLKWPERNQQAMTATLERLEQLVTKI